MWNSIKGKLIDLWLLVSSLALAIGYVVLTRRGDENEALRADLKRQTLTNEMEKAASAAKESQDVYDKNTTDYTALKSAHADLLHRIGSDPQ